MNDADGARDQMMSPAAAQHIQRADGLVAVGDALLFRGGMLNYREHWQPTLFSRQRMDDWAQSGKKRLGDRLRDKTIAILDSHKPEPLPDKVREEVAYILKQGKAR